MFYLGTVQWGPLLTPGALLSQQVGVTAVHSDTESPYQPIIRTLESQSTSGAAEWAFLPTWESVLLAGPAPLAGQKVFCLEQLWLLEKLWPPFSATLLGLACSWTIDLPKLRLEQSWSRVSHSLAWWSFNYLASSKIRHTIFLQLVLLSVAYF